MEHRQPNTLKACENHGHISSALLARHHRSATRASAPVMGNSAAQVCCCERRPENPNRRRGEGQPRSPHLQVSQAQSKSSSSSWPFDFDSFGEAQEEPKKAPLAQQAADEAEQKVKILEISALKVMGKLRKFPTSGMGWGSGWSAKERFFAALPTKAQLKPSSKKEVTHQFVYEIEQGGAGSRGSIDRLKCWRSGRVGQMSAIDICDSDEDRNDEALARKREAIRRRRGLPTASEELPSTVEVPPAKPPVELPTGPWECPACGACPSGLVGVGRSGDGLGVAMAAFGPKCGGAAVPRLKCNNCGRARPGTEEPKRRFKWRCVSASLCKSELWMPRSIHVCDRLRAVIDEFHGVPGMLEKWQIDQEKFDSIYNLITGTTSPETAAHLHAATNGESRRKRRKGWDDWEEQAKQAAAKASTQNASMMRLQYWDSQAAFEKKEPPKGSIPLLGITRVYIDEQNKNEVVVKYANGAASEPVLLRLHFPSHMTAEQWRKELRQIRATL
eukprot:s2644_g7.t2